MWETCYIWTTYYYHFLKWKFDLHKICWSRLVMKLLCSKDFQPISFYVAFDWVLTESKFEFKTWIAQILSHEEMTESNTITCCSMILENFRKKNHLIWSSYEGERLVKSFNSRKKREISPSSKTRDEQDWFLFYIWNICVYMIDKEKNSHL
jgi:hypothetical protein